MSDADVDRTESQTREGYRTAMYQESAISVTVVIPGAPMLLFDGTHPTPEQIQQLSQRDIAIARAMLLDALNQINRGVVPAPIALPIQQPGWHS